MHTDGEMLQALGVWRHYTKYYESDTIRDLRLREAKERAWSLRR